MMCFGSEWGCNTWPNRRPPRVTCLFVKTFTLNGSRPRDLRGKGKALGKATQLACPRMFLVIYVLNIVFNIVILYIWAWTGPGLSPGPWSCVILYATSTTVVTTVTIYCNRLIYMCMVYHVTTVPMHAGLTYGSNGYLTISHVVCWRGRMTAMCPWALVVRASV
jgi:hypothetical protein